MTLYTLTIQTKPLKKETKTEKRKKRTRTLRKEDKGEDYLQVTGFVKLGFTVNDI